MMKLRKRRALALAGSAVALSIALTGCSAITSVFSGDAPRDEETGEVTEESNIDIFALKVGDCMPASDATGEMQDADVVPCTEPHADEIFYEFELPEGEFPSDTDIQSAVETECVPAFGDFVGLAYADSTLDFWWISPTAESWDQADDRLVQCAIYDPADDALVVSLEGAAR
ncbi:septum formation family protein [Microbacterium sp. GXF0217]